MDNKPLYLTDLNEIQIRELVESLGEPVYRARQLEKWIYCSLAVSYEEMANLPQSFREKLTRHARLHSLIKLDELQANDGTIKTLFSLADGKTIESTLMSYPLTRGKARYTICISTQVGCPIGCPFCATGRQGLERNLTPGEIIDQVLYFSRLLRDRSRETESDVTSTVNHITNLVFMGMGEPLVNYEAVWQAIEMLNSPSGLGLGARNMVISTVGIVPQIKRLSQEKLQVGLAVSLHASNNTLRNKLVPINRKFPLEMLIPACREYCELTGRRITFEYILFKDINDSLEHARSLAALLVGMNCHVNLIPANSTASKEFGRPPRNAILAFEQELKQHHLACTLRQSRGQSIDAGCGQLRSRYIESHRRASSSSVVGKALDGITGGQ